MADSWEENDWEKEDFVPALPATKPAAEYETKGQALLAATTDVDLSKFADEDKEEPQPQAATTSKPAAKVRLGSGCAGDCRALSTVPRHACSRRTPQTNTAAVSADVVWARAVGRGFVEAHQRPASDLTAARDVPAPRVSSPRCTVRAEEGRKEGVQAQRGRHAAGRPRRREAAPAEVSPLRGAPPLPRVAFAAVAPSPHSPFPL